MEAEASAKENKNHVEIQTEFAHALKQQQPILNDPRQKIADFWSSRHVSTARFGPNDQATVRSQSGHSRVTVGSTVGSQSGHVFLRVHRNSDKRIEYLILLIGPSTSLHFVSFV